MVYRPPWQKIARTPMAADQGWRCEEKKKWRKKQKRQNAVIPL